MFNGWLDGAVSSPNPPFPHPPHSFVGAQRIVDDAPATTDDATSTAPRARGGAAPPPPPPPDLDLHLRRLAKRDPATRAKALRSLRDAVGGGRPPEDAVTVLPPLASALPRLVVDGDRGVRLEAARALDAAMEAAGRGAGPHVRSVAGPWWLAAHDDAADVSAAATTGWHRAFPTPDKSARALAHASDEVCDYLTRAARGAPDDVGDPSRDNEEELAARGARARAASLRAAAALLEARGVDDDGAQAAARAVIALLACGVDVGGATASPAAATDAPTHPQSRASRKAAAKAAAAAAMGAASPAAVAAEKGGGRTLLATSLAQRSPPAVRAAALRAVAALAAASPAAVAEAAPSLAPPVLASLGERDAGVAGAAWDAALRLTRAAPATVWATVDASSLVLPKLAAALAAPMAADAAHRGLLPLLAMAPPSALLPAGARSLARLLDATAAGALAASGLPSAVTTAGTALREGLRWAVTHADEVGGEDAVRSALFEQGSLATSLVPAALSPGGRAALELVLAISDDSRREGVPAWTWAAVVSAVADAASAALAAALSDSTVGPGDEPYAPAGELATTFLRHPGGDRVAAALARPLLPAAQRGDAPAAAASLLATLIAAAPDAASADGGGDATASLDPGAAADALLAGPRGGPVAAAHARVVVAAAAAAGDAGATVWRDLVAEHATNDPRIVGLLADALAAAGVGITDRWRAPSVDAAARDLAGAGLADPSAPPALASLLACGVVSAPVVDAVLHGLAAAVDARADGAAAAVSAALSRHAVLLDGGDNLRAGAGAAAAALLDAACAAGGGVVEQGEEAASDASDADIASLSSPSASSSSDDDDDDDASSSSSSASSASFTAAEAAIAAWAGGARLASAGLPPSAAAALASALARPAADAASSRRRGWPAAAAARAAAALAAAPASPVVEAVLRAASGDAHATARVANALASALGPAALVDASSPLATTAVASLLAHAPSRRSAAAVVASLTDDAAVGGHAAATVLDSLAADAATPGAAAALARLLTYLTEAGGPAAAAAMALFGDRVAPALAAGGALRAALPPVAAAFRGAGGDGLAASGLPDLTLKLLADVDAAPPLAQAVGSERAAALAAARGVAAALPLDAAEGAVADPRERNALVACVMRQLAGERAAAAAAAAAARADGSGSVVAAPTPLPAPAASSNTDDDIPATLAALVTALHRYAADDVPPDAWPLLVRRVRTGVAAASAAAEAAAEATIAAAVGAARALAGPAAADAPPAAAFEILRRLAAGGGAPALAARRAAGAPVASALRAHPLPGGTDAWGAACAAQLTRFGGKKTLPPPDGWRDALSDAVRLSLAAGAVAAAAAASGGPAATAAATWFGAAPAAWAAAGGALAEAATTDRGAGACAAASEADAWGADTGVDAFAAAAALALTPTTPAARAGAVAFLACAPLLPRAAAVVVPADGDDASSSYDSDDGAAAADDDGGASALESAGLRPELAAVLAAATRARAARGGRAAPAPPPPPALRAAWAITLARLEADPPGSPERTALAASLHAVDGGLACLLDGVASDLPLDAAAAATQGGRARAARARAADPAAAAAAAAASRAAGASTDTAWTLSGAVAAARGDLGGARGGVPLFRAALRLLPASSRAWFAEVRSRGLASSIEKYAAAVESGPLIDGELAAAVAATRGAPDAMSDGLAGFTVRVSPAAREAVAVLEVDDGASLELAVKMPPAWPLRGATVDVRRAVGVPDARVRRWLLSAAAFLRAQNGGLAGAVRLWRANVAREFAGVEECLICYSVVATAGGGGLPRHACRTCGKRFHGACLFKWFRSSARAAACPHCQSAWGG